MNTPAEIDARLAELAAQGAALAARVNTMANDLHHAAGDRRVDHLGRPMERGNRNYVAGAWTMDLDEILATPVEAVDLTWRMSFGQLVAEYPVAVAALAANRAEAAPLEARFAAAPWSRFFLCTATGGHIHATMACSTCGPTTTFAWLPALSGRTEADTVAEHGALLCSVCFPSAPVEWTNGRELEAEARKAARCPGSGAYVASEGRSRYVRCPDCNTSQARTPRGAVRAHAAH